MTPREEAAYPRPAYAWYVVAVLTLVYVFSFIDRQILSLLVGPIRRDLGISDTQMSLLMGFTFAVFYTFFGIPLGRWADSGSRRTIIALGFVAWSAFTAACGLARNYLQMLLCRVGVGVGEAALSPAAYSMLTDYFPPERRATALGVYGMGIYIGSGLAFLLGGVVVGLAGARESYDLPLVGATRAWQVIFFAVGLPGVALAALLYTVAEPLRRGAGTAAGRIRKIQLGDVAGYLWENRGAMLCHNFGFGFISFTTYAAGNWNPTYFIRRFGWSAAEIGIAYGLIAIFAGSAGIACGGRAADWLRARGYVDANLRVALYAILINLPIAVATYLVPSDLAAITLLVPATFLTSAPFGVAAAAIQHMMPNPMRAQASSIYIFITNLVGLGLGPTAVAVATDRLFASDQAIGYSLLLVHVTGKAIAIILLWRGLAHYRAAVERLRVWSASTASGSAAATPGSAT